DHHPEQPIGCQCCCDAQQTSSPNVIAFISPGSLGRMGSSMRRREFVTLLGTHKLTLLDQARSRPLFPDSSAKAGHSVGPAADIATIIQAALLFAGRPRTSRDLSVGGTGANL